MAKMGDIATYINGYAFKPTDWSNEGTPIIRIQDLTGNSYQVNRYNGKYDPKYEVNYGDVLVSWSASLGVYVWTGETAVLNQHIFKVQFDKADVNKDFFVHQVECILNNASSEAHGATMKHLTKPVFDALPFYLPNVDEQKKIAKELNKVSYLISLRKQQLSKLDELVKSRFIELFGDPKLNDKGWKSGIVSDYFEVKGGKRIPKGMGYSDKKTDHPYLRATDMKNETILEDDIHYIDEDVFQHIKRYTVKGGDIYLTNVGVNLGMAGVIPQKFDGASLTENAVKLVPKTEKVIDGLFLAHYINSPGIQEYINERKMSVGVPKLAIFRIETMPLLIPPMDIQQDFNTFVEQTDKSKLAIQQSLEKLETLKKALMQKYFG